MHSGTRKTSMSSSSVGGLAGRDSPDCAEKRPPRRDVVAMYIYKFKVSRRCLLIGISQMKLPMLQQIPRPKLLPSRGSTHNLCTGCNSCNYSISVVVQVVHSTSLLIHHLFIAFFGHWIFQEHQLANRKFRDDRETFGKFAKLSHSSRNL